MTIRTEQGLMVCKIKNSTAQYILQGITSGHIPAKSISLKKDSKHSIGYVMSADYKFQYEDLSIFFYTGTQILVD